VFAKRLHYRKRHPGIRLRGQRKREMTLGRLSARGGGREPDDQSGRLLSDAWRLNGETRVLKKHGSAMVRKGPPSQQRFREYKKESQQRGTQREKG